MYNGVSIIFGIDSTVCSSVIKWYVIVLTYLESQMYKISCSWEDVLISYVLLVKSPVSGLMRFRDGSDKETASNFGQISENVRRRAGQ
jgi:hypothetical protein